MDNLVKGTCQFEINEAVSNKTGNKYKRLEIVIGGYRLNSFILINDDQLELIKLKKDKQ